MNAYFLKRESVIRLLSLVSITTSVFLNDTALKIALLVLGISGLIAIAYFKKQKVTMIIYVVLLILAVVGYYLISEGIMGLPKQ